MNTVSITKTDKTLCASLNGRLDAISSPEVEKQLMNSLDGIEKLIFDFTELEYISSAGLRVILTASQILDDQGEMVIKNARSDILDVFEVTGIIDDLIIE